MMDAGLRVCIGLVVSGGAFLNAIHAVQGQTTKEAAMVTVEGRVLDLPAAFPDGSIRFELERIEGMVRRVAPKVDIWGNEQGASQETQDVREADHGK